MITVLVLTQFVFLILGTIFLKGMVNANGDISSSLYFLLLDKYWLWLFLLPLAGVAYTLLSYQINKGPFTLIAAWVVGAVISVFCLLVFVSVLFFPSA
jgi:hypothetical protein